MFKIGKMKDFLQNKGIKKTALKTQKIVSGSTYEKIRLTWENDTPADNLTLGTVSAICSFLNCSPSDILEYIPDPPENA